MDTNTAYVYYFLFALLNIRTLTTTINDCKYLPGLYRVADRLKLQGITDEELLQLPKCLQDKARVFIISVKESNFTLSALVNALPERVKQNVVVLEINDCDLRDIPAGILRQLPKLRYIYLQNNNISVVEKDSFSNMSQLQSINLSNNRLRIIPTTTFTDLPSLNEISLQNNELLEISQDAFQNAPSLVVIYLDNNQLESLPYSALRTSPIKFLHVTNNKITEISQDIRVFSHLENLYASKTSFIRDTNPLSNNHLSTTANFGLSGCWPLDIRNNSLQRVSVEISTIQSLQELHLTWNNLTTLPREISMLLEDGSLNIALGNNPWHCNCSLAWLISWVKTGFSKETVTCESPDYLNMSQFDTSQMACEQRELKKETHLSGYVILAVVLGLVFVALFVTILFVYIWKKNSKTIKSPIKMIVNGQYYIPQSDDDSPELNSSVNTTQNTLEDFTSHQKQFSENKRNGLLRLGKRLGRGAFGDVFEGLVADSKNGTWKKVAIKKIRDSSTLNDSENLMSEYRHMTDIGRHPNIIQVYGIGKLEGSLIMVMELADNGDMLAHLKEIERLNQRSIRNLDSSEEKFYLKNKHPRLFLHMWHVAKGMEYLSQLKVVHRDVAARNVLLAAGHVAKLSDFGLSRDVYENGYYYQSSQGRLPYKWMSPETLSSGKFTSSSDVWSFGVFLWEIVTLGSTPYPGILPDMLINMYKSKYIMPQPPLCPDSVYSIIKNCWRHTPVERTNFTSLVDQLDNLVQTVSEKHYMEITSVCAEDQVSLVEAEMSPDQENCLPEVTHISHLK